MQYARPKMPGLTYIAGIHIKPAAALPADVQVNCILKLIQFGRHVLIIIKTITRNFLSHRIFSTVDLSMV